MLKGRFYYKTNSILYIILYIFVFHIK